MSWLSKLFTSSIGRKVIMSLTGLFFVLFLLVHLLGNLQLLHADGGKAFNHYADFMAHNGFIQGMSWIMKFLFGLHAIVGLILWRQNASAKGQKYAVKVTDNTSFAGRNMIWLGILILVFLILHMGDFWFQMHYGDLGEMDGVKDLAKLVAIKFSSPIYVGWYVFSMIVLGIHLWHGFESAFQTLGARHPKYDGFVAALGKILSVVIALGFAIIPIIMYLNH
ncbi:MAG TPA: succinate dehydrogenase cytochrome b subunit [Saprospiraceae bacterium]|nr:succinate dehydrogenase cytochrome b subunit [Saprospiraceae bacterium]